MNNASNALLAKCRAKYSGHLSLKDTEKLAECRSVAEVTAYLKGLERYSAALSEINPETTHRGQLENALYVHHFEELAGLCRYELSVGESLSEYILIRGEIEQLLAFLRLLAAGRQSEYVFTFSDFWQKHSRLDFMKLSECSDYSDFLRMMEHTRYYKTLYPFSATYGGKLSYSSVEHALYDMYLGFPFSKHTKKLSPGARREIRQFIGGKIDMLNLSHIYRLKKYYRASPATITSMLYSEGTLPPGFIKKAVNAESVEELYQMLPQKLRCALSISEGEDNMGDVGSRTVIAKSAEHLLRFSVHPSSVLLAYIQLADDQLRDLFTIIEGVRYGIEPSRITDLIIIDDLQ